MMYTSGTTALPKGCPFTHEAMMQVATAVADRFRLSAADRMWDPLPLFHMGGLLDLLACISVGAAYVTQERWDPGVALGLMDGERCTFMYGSFETFTQGLIHHPDFGRTDLTRLREVFATGQPEELARLQAAFPQAVVVSSYGITEGGGAICHGSVDDPVEARTSTGGRPLRCTQCKIVDPESGADLPPGEPGEIVLRGSACFEGYHKDPSKTAEAWRGGWFHTGDLGTMDRDGRIAFRGRLKDMLKIGGENVAAVEIEDFLGTHPAVKIAQVVAIPDARYQEVAAAYVELTPGAASTSEELVEYCRAAIAGFKVPRHVRFVEEWPMSATKIQKFVLRERLLEELGLGT
jgi:fatty-acyl-CoA synthase